MFSKVLRKRRKVKLEKLYLSLGVHLSRKLYFRFIRILKILNMDGMFSFTVLDLLV